MQPSHPAAPVLRLSTVCARQHCTLQPSQRKRLSLLTIILATISLEAEPRFVASQARRDLCDHPLPGVAESVRLLWINSCLNGIKEKSGLAWPWEREQICSVKHTKMAHVGRFWKFCCIFKEEIDLHNVARMSDWPNFDYSPAAQCRYI